ncbi:hypothetical protein [Pontibacter litorisediminis]|uniref:hypothetical protein n=1 Tax=Pontibacter litorisediminis TaxID=1846260 RepID=UPI0023EC9910|nr:hypothetical protein [Pontibacter litorisediminis]
MRVKHIKHLLLSLALLSACWLTGCRTVTAPADGTVPGSMAPQRVDIRGSVVSSRYSEGQVVLEVENFMPSVNSRYDRAYVLVQPTAQMLGVDGQPISVSELHQGQNVAILLRGGGQGTRIGVGIARKLWVEEGL